MNGIWLTLINEVNSKVMCRGLDNWKGDEDEKKRERNEQRVIFIECGKEGNRADFN